MENDHTATNFDVERFVRLYPLRAPQIMWFLGAGASAAAGIPTAGQMVWDFKRQIYCAAQRISLAACSDLTNPVIQARIQQHFTDAGGYPPLWGDDEYAFYFERAYPDETDRRTYIEQKVRAAAPSYGHQALASLLRMDQSRVVWTTNFDRTLEDAVAQLFGSTTALTVATLGEPQVALQAVNGGRWPILGKLHGDFHSRRLKNVSNELQSQDAELRHALLESCRRYGLAVIGYSGRDRSVMEVLREAAMDSRAYPAGLFWFHRTGSIPFSAVTELISDAENNGIDAHLVEVETFDELLADVMHLIPDIPAEIIGQLDQQFSRASAAPIPRGEGEWPIVRLNALPILLSPTICRRFICDIGGTVEVRAAIEAADASVVATRRQVGVLAFGSDSEVRKAFQHHNIRDWDVHAIESHRLRYESQEHGLLHEALIRAMERERPVFTEYRRSGHLVIVDSSQQTHGLLGALKTAVGSLAGTVPGTSLCWAEAIRTRLDFRLDRLWLLIEPTVWIERTEDEEQRAVAKEFQRERIANRYNIKWNSILDGWTRVIVGPAKEAELRTFGIGDGVDAAFTIGRFTAFSRRVVSQ